MPGYIFRRDIGRMKQRQMKNVPRVAKTRRGRMFCALGVSLFVFRKCSANVLVNFSDGW